MRHFCILSGMVIFCIGYIGFCIKSYLIEKNKFDLFDEIVWFYQTFIKEKVNKLLTRGDKNDDCSKAKTD